MVAIPRSRGVEVGKTTETGLAPPSIAQSQIVPDAISNLGSTISGLGFQAMQKQNAEKLKQDEEFRASQALDARNKLRSFDNNASIALRELPDDQDTINNYKKNVLEERELIYGELNDSFQGDKRLQRILKEEYQTSQVAFEYGIDQELLRKKKNYNQNNLYSSISQIKDRFETATNDAELAQIGADLNTTLQFGLSNGIIDARDLDRQQDAFRKLRKDRLAELQREAIFSQAIDGKIKLDPTSKDDRDIIDANYQDAVLKGADPRELADSLAINQGIIPAQAKKNISASLFNGNNSQKLDSAIRIQSLIDENISLQNQFSSQELALSKEIYNRYDEGLPIDKVIEYAEAEIKQNKSQDRIIRTAKFENEYGKSGKKLIEVTDDLAKKIRGTQGFLGFGKAEVPQEIGAEFRNLARDYYLNEGVSLDTAIDSAKDKILSEWAVTNVGKKRFQKYAPETFYGEGKWIQNQAIQEVRKTTIDPMPNIKDEIRLQVIPSTLASGRPSYNIFLEKEGQAIEQVLGADNLPIVFTPDEKKTAEYKEFAEQIDKLKITPEAMEKLKKGREIAGKRRQVSRDKALTIISGGLY